jgi:predicted membrane-bound dolichyl-phosphate-mannose-protein mannosyltransferase
MELNEAELIEHEITIRNLRLTKEVTETRRSLIRWLALSLGIINPGESRLSALSVLDSVLYFQFNAKKDPSVEEMSEYINKQWEEINEKTLRYHLLQLNKAKIVGHSKGKYFLVQPQMGQRYDEEEWINHYFNTEITPIKEKLIAAMKELRNK